MKPSLRFRLLDYIVHTVCKIIPGSSLPWYLVALRCLLYPWQEITWRIERHTYDPQRDVYYIYGMTYAADVFRNWAKEGLPLNVPFRLVSRDHNVIYIERISFDPPHQQK